MKSVTFWNMGKGGSKIQPMKRRMNLPAGGRATGLDQLPESLFPLLACRGALRLTAFDIVSAVALFFVGEVLLSRLLYRFHLREHPY